MAELKLRVSLDTSYLKGQISRLPLEFAGANVSIRTKFDRQTIVNEFRLLNRYIGGKTFDVKIESKTLENLSAKVKNFQERLAELKGVNIEVGVGVVQSLSPRDAGRIRSGLRTAVLGGSKKILIPTTITPKITGKDVDAFKAAVKEKLSGISVDVKANVKGGGAGTGLPPDFMKYMTEQGLLGKTASGMTMRMSKDGGDIKQQLNDAVGSAEKIKSIFDGVAQSIATTGKSIANIQGKRLGLANVPLMAGAMEKRIERSASAIEGTESFDALKSLYPEINKTIVSLAALRGQVQQNTSKLSGFSLIIGLAAFAGVPLAKSIVKLTGSADKFSKLLDKLGLNLEAAFTKAAFNILNTASSRLLTGSSAARLLPPAAEPAGLLPPAYRGIGPSRNAGALPPAYRGLPPAYRGLPFGFDFKGLPPDASAEDQAGGLGPTVQQMRQQLFSSIRIAQVRVREIFDIVGDFDSRQKAAAQAKLDKAVQDFVKGLEDIARRVIVNVADLGATVRPALPSGRSPLLLPPAGGTTATGRMRITTGAVLGQPSPMRAPSIPSVPRPGLTGQSSQLASPLGAGYFAVGKGLKDIESAYGQAKKFLNTKNLPVTGAIADLGGEFGNAIKQVLLFGTAYKALAFLTSLPGEAFEAAKGLATYRNQLQAVTAESGTLEQSFAFVDGLATRFNVPLESARQGFVKLYASMQPAGFDQGQIENLFTGISKAAAAFGLSSDKVDRVNYAFAQMASKGQIMSEELKGQLGDVLPGALGLFAKAAQMSIPEFSKAMEDGAFKGKAMEQVLGNVATLLNDKFGTAAEGAAKTLQGAVNQIQNNLALMYQSFSPIVDGVAAAFGPQVNALIKDVTDTVKVLTGTFTQAGEGFNSLSPRAQGFYVAIQTLEPSLRQAGAAIADLGSRLAQLAPLFVEVLATAISFASSPLARAALLAAVAIGTLTAALKVLEVTGLKAALKAVYSFISSLAVGIPQATGIARVALIGLKLAVTGLFIGAVLVGLDLLIGKILEIGGAAQKSINDVKQLAADLDRLVGAQDMIGLATKRQEAGNQVIIAERLLEIYQKVDRINKEGGYGYGALSAQQNEFLKQYGKKTLLGGINVQPGAGIQSAEKQLASAMERRGMAQKSLETANRLAEDERRRRAAQTPTLTKVDLSGGDGAGGTRGTKTKLDTYDRSTLDFIKLRLEAEKQSLDQRRQAGLLSETGYKIAVAELELESSKEEVAEKLRLSRLAINKDNLSAADKILKLKDMEILAERELIIAADKRNIAVEGARKELSGPFDSAIKDANFSMVEQRMLLENLQRGIEGLTPKQQAYLKVLEMTRDLSEDEFDILKDRIKLTSGAIEKEILSKQGVQQGTILNELGGQLRLAQTLDPRVELRETLRQRNPLFSNAQIEEQAVLSEQVAAAQKAKDDLKGIASTISNAFGEAFKGIVTGSMTAREALTGFFQGVADSFADMVANMIAEYLKMALIKGIMSLIPGLGSFAGGANMGQSVAMPSSAGVGAGGGILQNSMGQGFGTLGPNFGIRQFANGGVVTGPTLGLVGEGRYNEAVIPLPDGKSVPVQLSGGDGGNQINSNITVNVSNGQAQSNATGSNSSELGRKIEGAVKQVIVGELRPGGLLASR